MENSWNIYYFRIFAAQLTELETTVEQLKNEQPDTYQQHPKFKLLKSIYECITKRVPANPADGQFLLGHTLGKKYASWRRVKRGMPDRYRLFFKFTTLPKNIVYVWFNDEDHLRKAGSKTDVYRTFQKMLDKNEVPNSIDELLQDSI